MPSGVADYYLLYFRVTSCLQRWLEIRRHKSLCSASLVNVVRFCPNRSFMLSHHFARGLPLGLLPSMRLFKMFVMKFGVTKKVTLFLFRSCSARIFPRRFSSNFPVFHLFFPAGLTHASQVPHLTGLNFIVSGLLSNFSLTIDIYKIALFPLMCMMFLKKKKTIFLRYLSIKVQ